jgi:hypothetical protein
VIRPFGLRDVLTIRRLAPQGVAFDLERLLLDAPSPLQAAVTGYLSRYHLGAVTCIHDGADERKDLGGFVQAWPNARQSRWDLAFMAPALDQPSAGDIWYRLLTYLIIFAAEQGVYRLFAHSAEDGESEEVFRQSGFHVAVREEVFRLAEPRAPLVMPKGLRALGEPDRVAVQALYGQVVPRSAQDPDTGSPFRTTLNPSTLSTSTIVAEYVWEERGQVLAYYGLLSGSRGYWLEVQARPERRGDLLHHIKYVLSLAPSTDGRPVYCAVPDYNVGLGWLLRALHFQSHARQVLLVAHTAVRARVRQVALIPRLEGSVETGAPARAPYQARGPLAPEETLRERPRGDMGKCGGSAGL